MNLVVCKLSVCVLAPGFTHVQYIGTLTQIATDSPNIFTETFFFLISNDLHTFEAKLQTTVNLPFGLQIYIYDVFMLAKMRF